MQPQVGAPVSPPPMGQPMFQSPEPPAAPSRFHNLSRWLFIALFAVVGGLTTYLIFAQTRDSTQYYWYSQRYEETYWDGQVHTKLADCYNNGFICHDNGTMIFTGGFNGVWQSNPKSNNAKLKSAAWYGPFEYSAGPYYGYGYGITGQQQTCFMLKDLTSGKNAHARITLRVQNQAFANQKVQTLITVDGSLSETFKKSFTPVCVAYSNRYDAYAQQYLLFVKSGTVQIDYVDHLTQYYSYDYNPYPYDYVGKSMQSRAPAKQHYQSGTLCNAKLKDTTKRCLSSSDLTNAAVGNRLTGVQLNPANQD